MSNPSDPFLGVNTLDPAFRADPYPALAHLRAAHPVHEVAPLGLWRLSRYADCTRLLRDAPVGVRLSNGTRLGEDRLPPAMQGFGNFMLQQDPPTHTRLRRLVSKAFTPRAVERLRAHVQAFADSLVDRALERGELDAIADLALPVPSTVICELMGVPLADRDRFTQWTAHATHLLAAFAAAPEVLERGVAASQSLAEYFTVLVAERRGSDRDDLLSNLIRAEEAGDRLSPEELLSQSIGLLIAGFETTIGLIGNGLLALVRHPDELRKLRANPGLIASAVEECLRFDGPILLTVRIPREELRFGDQVIPKDRLVMALLGSANRDPEVFPDPERFDIARTPNEHMAFGGGTHFCLGAHLARMEAQAAIGALVRRTAEIELMSEELVWGQSLFRVLGELPLRVKPA